MGCAAGTTLMRVCHALLQCSVQAKPLAQTYFVKAQEKVGVTISVKSGLSIMCLFNSASC